MRKCSFLLFALLALLLLSGCGNKPGDVTKQFLNAIQGRDFTTAKNLATKDSQELLNMLKEYSSKMSEEQLDEVKDNKFSIVSTQITGETAVVEYEQYSAQDPDKKETKEMKLVKEDGKWKVKLEKSNAGK